MAAVGAVAVGVAVPSGDEASRADVEELTQALRQPTQQWGRIEVQGMRPAIADLVSGEGVPPETVAGEARAWQGGLGRVGDQLAGIPTVSSLRPVLQGFREALPPYLEAARLFEQAAAGPPEERLAQVDRGIAEAKRGARLYNEASMLLQAARRKVGLAVAADFPDHPAAD